MLIPKTDHVLGDPVGRYRLLGELARGGMGIVYVAAAQGPAGFSKLVALKELRPDLVEDGEFLTMFMEEARVAARLNHPNIVQTNDVDACDGRHFIAMEYLEGRSFYHVLKRFAPRGGFPLRMALSVLRDALAALDYAHEVTGFDGQPLGFVHRDISPHNIFVTFEGHTKVIDFGIAKARDSSLETKTGVLKGRVNYMSPEQLLRRADRRSDLFSVGAILFEILSGRRLWQGMGEIEILAALTRSEVPSLRAANADANPELTAICERALAPRPEDRYSTAAEMRDAIDHYLWSSGGAPRHREMSDMLLQEFEVERAQRRELLEGALLRLQTGDHGQLATLDQDPRDPSLDSRYGGRSYGSHPSHPSKVGHNSSARRALGSMGTGNSRVIAANSQVRHSGLYDTNGQRHSGVHRMVSDDGAPQALAPLLENDGLPSHLEPLQPMLEPLQARGGDSWVSLLSPRRSWPLWSALGIVAAGGVAIMTMRHPAPAGPTGTGGAAATPAASAGAVPVPAQPLAAQPVPGQPVTARISGSAVRPAAVTGAGDAPRVDEAITLSVGVSPSNSQIYIDGELMPSNPFIGRFSKTGEIHRVRALAPGYRPKERVVTFADNVMIDLSLVANPAPPAPTPPPSSARRVATRPPQRRPEPIRTATASAPPSVSPAPAVTPALNAAAPSSPARTNKEVAPRGEWEPPRKRAIDTSNPYDQER
jgi:serine/threonine-protein kinase